MKFLSTDFEDVFVIEPEPCRDERGFLARTCCQDEFASHGLNTQWVQQNHSRTHGAGSVRGMHFQDEPCPEIKLVRCIAGRVWDVVVDVRRQSTTFGRWQAFELSTENMRAVYVPAGYAHGFQCLEDQCELFYLMSERYMPSLARGVKCTDSEVGVAWPLPVANLSPRDLILPTLRELA